MQKHHSRTYHANNWILAAGFASLGLMLSPVYCWSQPTRTGPAEIVTPVASGFYPVVLNGRDLPALLDQPISTVRIYAAGPQGLRPVPHQVDRRDENGQFDIAANPPDARFDANDELVFMSADAGHRLATETPRSASGPLLEVRLGDPHGATEKWIYLALEDTSPPPQTEYIRYVANTDIIETDFYQMGFSSHVPFICNHISLKENRPDGWSPDLIDTMKLRHSGKLFGMLDFLRTQEDYKSHITGVRSGPVRVIRRTENRVRILWYLRTPVITVDYINYRHSFNMDIQINLPFPLGLVFRHVTTLATIDWSPDPAIQPMTVYSDSDDGGYPLQGRPEKYPDPYLFAGDKLIFRNPFGNLLARFDFDPALPIEERLFLADDQANLDPPEDIPGQFGNAGFFTSGWEKVGAGRHHVFFTAYLVPEIAVQDALRLLDQSPGLFN